MKLKSILGRLRLQQKMVADAIDVSPLSVHLWANGKAMPSAQNVSDLLAYLQTFDPDLTVHDLIPPKAA